MSTGDPVELERRYVKEVYSQMAPQVAEDRFRAWPNVRQFILKQPVESLIADIGCGSGKYFSVTERVFMVGVDVCQELLNIANTKSDRSEVCLADGLVLPFRDEVFDAVISVSVVHHFATERRREEAVRELARVVKKGGKVMIYVWALEQTHRQFCAQDVLVPWFLQSPTTNGIACGVREGGSLGKPAGWDSTPQEQDSTDPNMRILSIEEENDKADKIISGSVTVGIEPAVEQSSPQLSAGDEGELVGMTDQKKDEEDWSFGWGRGFQKLFSFSSNKQNKSELLSEPAPSKLEFKSSNEELGKFSPDHLKPPPVSLHPTNGTNTTNSGPWVSRSNLVTGLARFSPMLGRKLAVVLGTESPTAILLKDYAESLTQEILADATTEYLLSYHPSPPGSVPDLSKKNEEERGGGDTRYRYYHVFKEGELVGLVSQVPSLKITQSYYDHANWCVIAEKQ